MIRLSAALAFTLLSATSLCAQEAAIGDPAGSSAEQDPTTEATPTGSIMADVPAVAMPAACEATPPASDTDAGDMPEGLPAHGEAMMQGILQVRGPFLASLMAEDPDIAFACAMIAHHQAAINMAGVALARSQDETLRQAAQEITNQHRSQIEKLTGWVAENGS